MDGDDDGKKSKNNSASRNSSSDRSRRLIKPSCGYRQKRNSRRSKR